MRRIMRAFKIAEISGVDRPAQAHARAVIMKRDDGMDKRTFSASARRRDARSGASESDGSFPIENATDLRNAMRAVGRSKDPAKTKAHIRARAKALGLTSMLSDAFKREDNSLFKALGFIKGFGVSRDALAESIKSIVDDEDAADKGALIDETIKQFSETVEDDLAKTLSGGEPGDSSTEDTMSAALKKALGLAETASEDEVLKAIEAKDTAIAKAKEDADKAARERAVADLAKAAEEKAALEKRLAAIEEEREVAKFAARAEEIGLTKPLGEVLRKARSGDAEAFGKIEGLIKGLTAQAGASKLFAEFGTGKGGDALDPYAEITAKAEELRKADPKLTIEKAKAKVIEDPANREIVKRYREDRRAALRAA